MTGVLFLTFLFEATAALTQSDQPAKAVFLSPESDALWTGEQRIKIKLRNIAPREVRSVELYLDGRLLKEFTAPPYVMTYPFGIQGQNRTLKAVVRGAGLKPLASAELKSYQVYESHEVEVRQMLVPVVVKDKKGNYVRGLKKEDFLLFSNDKPVEISHFKSSGTERFNMVQVIDISYSMRDKIHDVLQASKDFTLQLMTGSDRATYVFFNQRVYEHFGFTGNMDELIERLDLRAPVMGGTALYDAIAYTLNIMNKTPGWNIMVLFSDGKDNSSYIDRYSLEKKVGKSPVVIYAIDNRELESNDVLQKVCSLSGGMMFPLTNVKKTKKVYEKIREEIKAQYVLYFNPARGGISGSFKRFHTLAVKVKNRGYDIRTIKGYYY